MGDLRQLEHFVAVVEAGGFRAAALRVHLSAPALTRSVQVLEDAFGTRLLDRNRDRVRPTPAGEIVLAEARHLVARHRQIGTRLKAFGDLAVGQLNVGVSPVVADLYLGEAVGILLRDHPGLSVDVQIGQAGKLLPELAANRIDLVIALRAPLDRESDLVVEPFYEDEESWWVRRDHPLAACRELTPDEVRRFPVACQHLPPTMEGFLDDVFLRGADDGDDGGRSLPSLCRCDSYDLLFRIAASSDVIAGVPLRNGRRAAGPHGLARLDFRASAVRALEFGLARRRRDTPVPAMARFVEVLRALAASDRDAGARGGLGEADPAAPRERAPASRPRQNRNLKPAER